MYHSAVKTKTIEYDATEKQIYTSFRFIDLTDSYNIFHKFIDILTSNQYFYDTLQFYSIESTNAFPTYVFPTDDGGGGRHDSLPYPTLPLRLLRPPLVYTQIEHR